MGRFGRTAFEPVTSTQFAWFAVPVPRLKPIQTFPSFVPAIACESHFGEYLTWLMYDRSASVPFVRSGLVMYQFAVPVAPPMLSQTRYVPSSRWPQPVVAPAGPQSSPPGIPPWKRSIGWTNDLR